MLSCPQINAAPIIRASTEFGQTIPGRRKRQGLAFRSVSVKYLFRLLVLLPFAASLLTSAAIAESTDQTVDYLLKYVATSHTIFIRNGAEHTPAEAVEHIKAKYEHFKKEIKTPEDFIRLVATRSLLTGQPYLVRAPGGKARPLDEWLSEALAAHRAAVH